MSTTLKSEKQIEEVSIKDLVLKFGDFYRFIRSQWLIITFFGIGGAILGISYSFIKSPIYTASSTFVLDDGHRAGGLGQFAGLASMAGIDIGGDSNGSMFSSDNILELYRSRSMIEKALFTTANFNGQNRLIIDRFIDFKEIRSKWESQNGGGFPTFKNRSDTLSRQQDSIVSEIVKVINKEILTVFKPDKKLSIIRVDVACKDEIFAQIFNIKLVENVNNFYVQTKTKNSNSNVRILQHQADSVRKVLDNAIGGVASAIDMSPNANPLLLTLRVPSQKRQIDVQSNTAIYTEIIKNLELAKISLRQEAPLIQVIDKPVLPLEKQTAGKIKSALVGFFLLAFISAAYLSLKRIFKKIMQRD